jgi:steroid 5-alpha reductase family enzyme
VVDVFLLNACLIAALMLAMWLISLPLNDVSIVDIAWGLGFVLTAWASYFAAAAPHADPLVPLLTTIWGLRLSAHLARRNIGGGEDFRYAAMRERHPRSFPLLSLLTVFALQGTLMWVVALPLQTVGPAGPPLAALRIVGVLLWGAGFLFESIGDWQLARFKSDRANAGRVFDRGLWRYTRHPNYFGDFLVWWGLYFLSLASGGRWWSVVGPVVMSVLLLRISGVTLLESTLRSSKEGYPEYIARTNAFFPWRPK